MDERSFQKLLRRTVAIPVALLVLLAGVLVVEILTLTGSLHQVEHTDQVITDARQVMRYMVDMESSARGFELTGDERFLEPFERAKSQIPGSIDALSELTSQNALQHDRIQDIRTLDENWIHWAEHEIATHV